MANTRSSGRLKSSTGNLKASRDISDHPSVFSESGIKQEPKVIYIKAATKKIIFFYYKKKP